MATKRHRLVVERLEQRQLLAASVWFEDTGQQIGTNTYGLDFGDLDGDGDLDALVGCTNLPGGPPCSETQVWHFTDSGQRLNTVSTQDVEFGDLDGDGDLDAYLANGNSLGGNVPDRVWLNDGAGKFTDSGQRLGTSLGRSVKLGDLDGDGDLDAVVANGSIFQGGFVEQANEIWLNDGIGRFTSGQALGNAATNQVVLGDIDNDGDLDALFANLGQDNQVWLNTQPIAGDANRDGVFNQLDIIQVLQAAKYQTGQPATWAEGDFNRDGLFDPLDIVAALQTGKYGQA